jgi:hypothetical protein
VSTVRYLIAVAIGSVVLLVALVFALVWLRLFVATFCHECLALPVVAQCERGNNAVSVQVASNRAHGYIVRRKFAGCVWYWHEADTGGN